MALKNRCTTPLGVSAGNSGAGWRSAATLTPATTSKTTSPTRIPIKKRSVFGRRAGVGVADVMFITRNLPYYLLVVQSIPFRAGANPKAAYGGLWDGSEILV